MLAFDTNLVVYAANADAPEQEQAAAFLDTLARRQDVVVCELMLIEVYLKLRNPAILRRPLDAATAAAHCQAFRNNANWHLVESAPVMAEVWRRAAAKDFALRRIIDARLALTLCHHGVNELGYHQRKRLRRFRLQPSMEPAEGIRVSQGLPCDSNPQCAIRNL